MLLKYAEREFIKKHFFKKPDTLFHNTDDREYWNTMAERLYPVFKEYEANIEGNIYAPLLATDYMRFERDGNRSVYEDIYFGRRMALFVQTSLEAMSNDGSRIDRIINLLWLILEETTWCVPAHSSQGKNSDCLPCNDMYVLDLFAAETGALLIWVHNTLKQKLDAVSVNITPRIIAKVRERICETYRNSYFCWMGYNEPKVNNWNPWINSNVILTVQTVYGDCEEAWTLMESIIKSLNCYAICQPKDGACDEGITYWGVSHLCFIEALYSLYVYSDGTVNLLEEPQVVNMFEFYEKMYIGNNYVVNFADCTAKNEGDYGTIYKFAKRMNNSRMFDLGKRLYDLSNGICFRARSKFTRIFDKVLAEKAYKDNIEIIGETNGSLIESTQIITARTKSGIFFAAKGGNNDESHNHNDVGNFIIYKNNIPFIIDSGNMEYTKDTFSDKRYTIWTNMSEYHNLPKIGGYNQCYGADYKAKIVKATNKEFFVDISEAYENRKSIKEWTRKFVITDDSIDVCEQYSLSQNEEVVLNFISAVKPEISEQCIEFSNDGVILKMNINTKEFDISVEEICIGKDKVLNRSWDGNIYRCKLSKNTKEGNLTYNFL